MNITENVPLSRLTSLHVGGPAKYVATITNDQELEDAVALAKEKQLPFYVLGKGSNTLFPDTGYPGVILLMANRELSFKDTSVTADAGVFMRLLVSKCHEQGIVGLEELAGIPGTVGGGVRGNAGTWDTEMKDVLETVTVYKPDKDGRYSFTVMAIKDCEFSYRHSIFKTNPDWIIVRATLKGMRGDVASAEILVRKDLEQRHAKQPYDAPSAGSVFKNPDKQAKIFSGALIEQAGLKGLSIGGAQISPKHGNFIINKGNATSADIFNLIKEAQKQVKQKFSVDLVPEIEIVQNHNT